MDIFHPLGYSSDVFVPYGYDYDILMFLFKTVGH